MEQTALAFIRNSYGSASCSDAVIMLNGKEYYTHKLILSRSPFLNAQIRWLSSEHQQEQSGSASGAASSLSTPSSQPARGGTYSQPGSPCSGGRRASSSSRTGGQQQQQQQQRGSSHLILHLDLEDDEEGRQDGEGLEGAAAAAPQPAWTLAKGSHLVSTKQQRTRAMEECAWGAPPPPPTPPSRHTRSHLPLPPPSPPPLQACVTCTASPPAGPSWTWAPCWPAPPSWTCPACCTPLGTTPSPPCARAMWCPRCCACWPGSTGSPACWWRLLAWPTSTATPARWALQSSAGCPWSTCCECCAPQSCG